MNTNTKLGIAGTLMMFLMALVSAQSPNATQTANVTGLSLGLNVNNTTSLNVTALPDINASHVYAPAYTNDGGYRWISPDDSTGYGVMYNYIPDCVRYVGNGNYFAMQGWSCFLTLFQ